MNAEYDFIVCIDVKILDGVERRYSAKEKKIAR